MSDTKHKSSSQHQYLGRELAHDGTQTGEEKRNAEQFLIFFNILLQYNSPEQEEWGCVQLLRELDILVIDKVSSCHCWTTDCYAGSESPSQGSRAQVHPVLHTVLQAGPQGFHPTS